MPKSIPSLFLKEFYFFIMLLIFVVIGLFAISRKIKAGWLLFAAIFGTLALNESVIYITAYYKNTGYSIIYVFLFGVSLLGFIQSVISFICKPIKCKCGGTTKKKKPGNAELQLEKKYSDAIAPSTIPFKVEMGMSKEDKIDEKEMLKILKSIAEKAKKDKKAVSSKKTKNK